MTVSGPQRKQRKALEAIKKVTVLFGTRPEAIKLAPVILELMRRPNNFACSVLVTAQHREMLDQVLDVFGITPDIDLDIMEPEQDLCDLTARLVSKLGGELSSEQPDLILVQGDTTSTFVGALAAFYHKIAIGHVESGLRTFDKFHPFPEEVNRKLTTAVADLHFAPTDSARKNLLNEGVADTKIFVTGNTVIDALFHAVKAGKDEDIDLPEVDWKNKKIVLVTSHRRENWEAPIERICRAIAQLKKLHSDVDFVFSVHLNPKVQRIARDILANCDGVHLIEPVGYLPFVQMMNKSYLILTDSGGIQEEAPSLGKPVLVMRDTTERPEAVEAGTVRVVGTDEARIIEETTRLLTEKDYYKVMSRAHNPYGDGLAAKRIVDILEERAL